MSAAPYTTADRLPKLCSVEDTCRALNISRSTFTRLRARQLFPIPEVLPRISGGPRFRGVDIELYLSGAYAVPTRKAG